MPDEAGKNLIFLDKKMELKAAQKKKSPKLASDSPRKVEWDLKYP